jgi:tellurite resistance protein
MTAAPRRCRTRISPALFGMPFGLAGLGAVWHIARFVAASAQTAAIGFYLASGVVWLVLATSYVAQGPRTMAADLRDRALAPFVPVLAITAAILGAGLSEFALAPGRVIVVVSAAVIAVLAGWLLAQWMLGGFSLDDLHPGYFLPGVGGGCVGAAALADVGLRGAAEAYFGIGVVSWVLLGPVITSRLLLRPALSPALQPTLAIEIGPPAVAALAYFALDGSATGPIAYGLGGYGALMVLVQIRLVPVYLRLPFTAGFWSFTFPNAAAAAGLLDWLARARPAGTTGYAISAISAVTLLIAAIAVRSGLALLRGDLLPRQVAAAVGSAD